MYNYAKIIQSDACLLCRMIYRTSEGKLVNINIYDFKTDRSYYTFVMNMKINENNENSFINKPIIKPGNSSLNSIMKLIKQLGGIFFFV